MSAGDSTRGPGRDAIISGVRKGLGVDNSDGRRAARTAG